MNKHQDIARRQPGRSNEAGFTLLEMLVSLVLLALVMSVLTLGVRGLDTGFERGVQQVSRQDMLLTASNVVRRDLSALVRAVDDNRERPGFRFEAYQGGVTFVGRARPQGPGSGLAMLSYEIIRRRGSRSVPETVLLRYQGPYPGSAEAARSGEPAELAAGPFDMQFAYLQASAAGNTWLPVWSGAQALPAAIRLTISDPRTPSLAGLLVVVALRADAEVGCIASGSQICSLKTDGRLVADAAAERRGRGQP